MKKTLTIILFCIMFCVVFAGCSNNSIVGTWAYVNDDGNITDSKMYFNDDGTCSDIPWHGSTGAYPVSYKVQDDGKLIFTMEWDGKNELERAESQEQAMNSRDCYYLSGDTLIFRKDTYKKV